MNHHESFHWDQIKWTSLSQKFINLVVKASTQWQERRPTPQASPSEISTYFTESLPEQGLSEDHLVNKLENLIQYSGYNGHPRWFGYITSSPDPIGVLGDFLSSSLNQNTNLWRIAPGATAIELQTLNWLKSWVGFSQDADGIFMSGGQMANMVALNVVRDWALGFQVRQSGVRSSDKIRFYVSDQCHYCHSQSLDVLGLGTESLALVPHDENYKMDLNKLQKMIDTDLQNGIKPVCVIATAGTVGVGAIDPVADLRKLTTKYKMWLHVDGAYGAPAVIADDCSSDLKAMALADSISLDPHKWLYAPIDAGVTLIQQKGLLPKTYANDISYLDQRTSQNNILDFVNYTPENSRPFRALKVWLGLLYHGRAGYKKSIEADLQLAQYMKHKITSSNELELLAPVSTSIVCWGFKSQLPLKFNNQLQLQIIEELEKQGIALISKALLDQNKIALRACFVNFRTTTQDVDVLLENVISIGKLILNKNLKDQL